MKAIKDEVDLLKEFVGPDKKILIHTINSWHTEDKNKWEFKPIPIYCSKYKRFECEENSIKHIPKYVREFFEQNSHVDTVIAVRQRSQVTSLLNPKNRKAICRKTGREGFLPPIKQVVPKNDNVIKTLKKQMEREPKKISKVKKKKRIIEEVHCYRCNRNWFPRLPPSEKPIENCAYCKSKYWNCRIICECQHCGHVWKPNGKEPEKCAKCKKPNWKGY